MCDNENFREDFEPCPINEENKYEKEKYKKKKITFLRRFKTEWKQNHATSAFVLDKVEFAWLFLKNFRNLEKSSDILFSFSTSE